MKFALVLVVVLVTVSAVPHPQMVQQEWNIFKSKHVKVYESVEEEAKRTAIFHKNLVKIEQHNKLYKQGLSTFKMGVTKFADMTSEEFMAYVNKSAVIGHPKVRGEKVVFSDVSGPPVEPVDWRTKNVVTPVKDQGPCGAAWSFAATGALESAYAIAHGELISLSAQQLIDCSKSYGNDGCNDGLPEFAYYYLLGNGIAYEKDYPYEKKDGTCHNFTVSPVVITNFADVKPPLSDTVLFTLADQPLSVGVYITDLWQHYTGGVLEDKNCSILGPSTYALAVGFDYESWILRNSWGTSWGEGGYIRLSFTTSCGIVDNSCSVAVA